METEIPSKLRWQCRRGMLELDVLLGNFLEKAYRNLNQENQLLFVKLLENNDQDLFNWLIGKSIPEDEEIAMMIDKVREHAQNSH
jgi:antitoxin CptB